MDTILKFFLGLSAAAALPFVFYLLSKRRTEKLAIYIIVILAIIGFLYGVATYKEAKYWPEEGEYDPLLDVPNFDY